MSQSSLSSDAAPTGPTMDIGAACGHDRGSSSHTQPDATDEHAGVDKRKLVVDLTGLNLAFCAPDKYLWSEYFTPMWRTVPKKNMSAPSPAGADADSLLVDKAHIYLDTELELPADEFYDDEDHKVGRLWAGALTLENGAEETRRAYMHITTDRAGGAQLKREAKIYSLLQEAGSRAARHFYGLFVDGEGTTALLMHDIGAPLKSYEDVPAELRQKVYDELLSIHDGGIMHRNMDWNSIYFDKKCDVHIVDLHMAKRHTCFGESCRELRQWKENLQL